MKGFRFLRDKKDVIQAGDEMRVPGRAPRWEVVGPHVVGMKYTRHVCKMTLRRRVPNARPHAEARSADSVQSDVGRGN